MKKYYLIVLYFFIALSANSQNSQQTTKDKLQVKIPKGFVELNDQQAKEYHASKKNGKPGTSYYTSRTFLNDSIYLSYSYLTDNAFSKMTLEDRNKVFNGLIARYKISNDSSKIETINGIRYSIIESHIPHDSWLHIGFNSDYKDPQTPEYINGHLKFKKEDEAKAWQYLNEFLQSVHFK